MITGFYVQVSGDNLTTQLNANGTLSALLYNSQIVAEQTKYAAVTATVGSKLTVTGGKTLIMYTAANTANTYGITSLSPNVVFSNNVDASMNPLGVYKASDGQNDYFEFPIYLNSASAVNVKIQFLKQASAGIMNFLIDGVSIGTIDQYNAGVQYNQTAAVASGSLIAGLHIVRVIHTTKNGSSSNYGVVFGDILIETV